MKEFVTRHPVIIFIVAAVISLLLVIVLILALVVQKSRKRKLAPNLQEESPGKTHVYRVLLLFAVVFLILDNIIPMGLKVVS